MQIKLVKSKHSFGETVRQGDGKLQSLSVHMTDSLQAVLKLE